MLICASGPLRWPARRAFRAGWLVEFVKKCYRAVGRAVIIRLSNLSY